MAQPEFSREELQAQLEEPEIRLAVNGLRRQVDAIQSSRQATSDRLRAFDFSESDDVQHAQDKSVQWWALRDQYLDATQQIAQLQTVEFRILARDGAVISEQADAQKAWIHSQLEQLNADNQSQ